MTRAKMPIVSGAGSSGDPHHQFGFSFDQRRCTGCKTCEMACRDYHDLGTGPAFRTVHEYAGGTWIQNDEGAWEHDVFAFYVSMSCNHCTNPVCLRFCASDAIAKDDFGFVRVDAARCTGCQVCALSCPSFQRGECAHREVRRVLRSRRRRPRADLRGGVPPAGLGLRHLRRHRRSSAHGRACGHDARSGHNAAELRDRAV